jgi:catechol 2,3-dioxygenase-like lactoylglutathione lyase family enzyme
MPLALIEFPADDLARARRFLETLLDLSLDERTENEGHGRQTRGTDPAFGLRASLPENRMTMSRQVQRACPQIAAESQYHCASR